MNWETQAASPVKNTKLPAKNGSSRGEMKVQYMDATKLIKKKREMPKEEVYEYLSYLLYERKHPFKM